MIDRPQSALRLTALLLAICLAAPPGSAAPAGGDPPREPPCLKGRDAQAIRESSLIDALWTAISGPQCSAVVRVLAELNATTVQGGRKLRTAPPLDAGAARKELDTARADAGYVDAVRRIGEGVTDPTARRIVEAAALEELGYFDAYRLVLDELRQQQVGAR